MQRLNGEEKTEPPKQNYALMLEEWFAGRAIVNNSPKPSSDVSLWAKAPPKGVPAADIDAFLHSLFDEDFKLVLSRFPTFEQFFDGVSTEQYAKFKAKWVRAHAGDIPASLMSAMRSFFEQDFFAVDYGWGADSDQITWGGATWGGGAAFL